MTKHLEFLSRALFVVLVFTVHEYLDPASLRVPVISDTLASFLNGWAQTAFYMSDPFVFATHTALFATESHSGVSEANEHRPGANVALAFVACNEDNSEVRLGGRHSQHEASARRQSPRHNSSKRHANAARSDFLQPESICKLALYVCI
jgi:hypothetical protein